MSRGPFFLLKFFRGVKHVIHQNVLLALKIIFKVRIMYSFQVNYSELQLILKFVKFSSIV